MRGQWRLFLAALRFVTLRSVAVGNSFDGIPPPAASRFVPLAGIVVGLTGALVYWCGTQLWPTSVALVLSLLVTVGARIGGGDGLYPVLFFFVRYNALMALSAAKAPFTLPEYLTLGVIMVAGHAASRALVVSVMATDRPARLSITHLDLGIALILGFAPSALLGIPGLIGLAAAITVRLAQSAYGWRKPITGFAERLDITQQLTEISFYLGALATWKYI